MYDNYSDWPCTQTHMKCTYRYLHRWHSRTARWETLPVAPGREQHQDTCSSTKKHVRFLCISEPGLCIRSRLRQAFVAADRATIAVVHATCPAKLAWARYCHHHATAVAAPPLRSSGTGCLPLIGCACVCVPCAMLLLVCFPRILFFSARHLRSVLAPGVCLYPCTRLFRDLGLCARSHATTSRYGPPRRCARLLSQARTTSQM